MLRDRSDNDKGIISVLEDGTSEVIHKRVEEEAISGGLKKHLLKHVCHNVEQEGGKGVSLAKAAAALDPSTRNAIEENRSLARVV
jgi:hypothetical protein